MSNQLDHFASYTPTRYYPSASKFLDASEIRDLTAEYIARRAPGNLKINLNISFPFCASRCFFCFCNTRKPTPELLDKYTKFLLANIVYFSRLSANFKFNDLLIGSGSVNLLSEKQLDCLLAAVFKNYQFFERNKTVEVFPDDDLTLGKLKILHDYGINKISLGVETFNEPIVTKANRQYVSPKVIGEKINLIRQSKINNINLDFILGLAEHNINGVLSDLRQAIDLEPAQIALYTLQPIKAYVTLFFQTKDKFYEHLRQFTSRLFLINDFMREAHYTNYAPNELVNVYYNNQYKDQLQSYYHDYPYWGGYQSQQADFSLGQAGPSYLSGQCFFTNTYKNNDYQFKENDNVFEIMNFNSDELILDFILSYWGRNMAIPLLEYKQYFGQDLLTQFPGLNKLIENKTLIQQGDKLIFNQTLDCKDRLLQLIAVFPYLND